VDGISGCRFSFGTASPLSTKGNSGEFGPLGMARPKSHDSGYEEIAVPESLTALPEGAKQCFSCAAPTGLVFH